MPEPISLTIDDACAALGLGKTALYHLIAAGKIDARKTGDIQRGTGGKSGGRTLILADSLRRYVESLPPAEIRIGRKAAETTNAAA